MKINKSHFVPKSPNHSKEKPKILFTPKIRSVSIPKPLKIGNLVRFNNLPNDVEK